MVTCTQCGREFKSKLARGAHVGYVHSQTPAALARREAKAKRGVAVPSPHRYTLKELIALPKRLTGMEKQLRDVQEARQRDALEIQRLNAACSAAQEQKEKAVRRSEALLAEAQQDNSRAVQAHSLFRELAQLLERMDAIKKTFLDWGAD